MDGVGGNNTGKPSIGGKKGKGQTFPQKNQRRNAPWQKHHIGSRASERESVKESKIERQNQNPSAGNQGRGKINRKNARDKFRENHRGMGGENQRY